MKVTVKVFAVLTAFFLAIGIIYGLWSRGEAVGFGALLLTGGLAGMIGFYLYVVDRRAGRMPEDDPYAEIADGAGEVGVYSPWSWWPLVLASGTAVSFAALAVGWWLLGIGAVVAVIALVGWVFEFSRGQHAH